MLKEAEEKGSTLKPLIRLKIDHTGYPIIKSLELSSMFSELLANPSDFLQWHKKNEIIRKAPRPGQNDCCQSDDEECDMDAQLQAQFGNYKHSAKYDLKSFMIKNLTSSKDQKLNPVQEVDAVDLINLMEKSTELNNISFLGDHIESMRAQCLKDLRKQVFNKKQNNLLDDKDTIDEKVRNIVHEANGLVLKSNLSKPAEDAEIQDESLVIPKKAAQKASKAAPKASKKQAQANTAAAIVFDKTKRNSNQILKNQTLDKMFVASKKVVEDIEQSSDDECDFIEKQPIKFVEEKTSIQDQMKELLDDDVSSILIQNNAQFYANKKRPIPPQRQDPVDTKKFKGSADLKKILNKSVRTSQNKADFVSSIEEDAPNIQKKRVQAPSASGTRKLPEFNFSQKGKKKNK